MKLWQAFAAALGLIPHPGCGDHVERVQAALRRADVLTRRKAVAARRVVDTDILARGQIERDGQAIRETTALRRNSATWEHMREVRELAAGALDNLDRPRRQDRDPTP